MNNIKIKNSGKVRFWKIAPGSGGSRWVEQRDNGCIAIGWNEMGDLDEYSNDGAIKKRFYEIRKKFWGKETAPHQLLTFYRKIRKGDKVVASSGDWIFGVGSVIGKYKYNKKLSLQQSVPVAWEVTFWDPLNVWDLPLSKELKNRLGLNRTVLKLKKNEWDEIYRIVSRTKNPFRNLTNWEGLLRAPWTEQEVVILFSKLSSVLRMKIEYVGTQFPDATIMVKKGGDWIAKEAEFEVCSSQFKEHGHLMDMKRKVIDCDFIICWEDDWTRRPKGIKVIELKNELRNLL